MNERIRKLALETDVWCDQNWAGHESYDIRWEEKFAELIVRECMSIVEGSPWNLPRGYKAVDQAELIKKHFGVEE